MAQGHYSDLASHISVVVLSLWSVAPILSHKDLIERFRAMMNFLPISEIFQVYDNCTIIGFRLKKKCSAVLLYFQVSGASNQRIGKIGKQGRELE